MTDPVKVVIPSHLRADRVLTLRRCLPPDKVILCVAEDQEAEYREHNPGVEIVTHPTEMLGITPKRQWIHDKFGDVFMIDDDIDCFQHFEHSNGEKACKVAPDVAYALIQRLAENTRDLGLYLFGFSPYPDVKSYIPLRPFHLTCLALGGSFGILKGSGLWWNTDIVTKDDYWITLLNAHKHRIGLVDLRYAVTTPQSKDFKAVGGCGAIRTSTSEANDTRILRKHFGDAVRDKVRTTYSTGKQGHEDQVSIDIPW